MLMQSSVRQAGTSPAVLSSPGVGLIPPILLNAAGTPPDPAVSVPSATAARQAATGTAEPALETPEIKSLPTNERGATQGQRVTLRHVTNRSGLVFTKTRESS